MLVLLLTGPMRGEGGTRVFHPRVDPYNVRRVTLARVVADIGTDTSDGSTLLFSPTRNGTRPFIVTAQTRLPCRMVAETAPRPKLVFRCPARRQAERRVAFACASPRHTYTKPLLRRPTSVTGRQSTTRLPAYTCPS